MNELKIIKKVIHSDSIICKLCPITLRVQRFATPFSFHATLCSAINKEEPIILKTISLLLCTIEK